MPVKLINIAEKAGVSVATVSRVIRKGREDSGPSGQKVLQIAKEMGYAPNRVRKPKGIGNVLFAMVGIPQEGEEENASYSISSFYGLFLYSVEKEIRRYQGTLTVCHAARDIGDRAGWIRQAAKDANSRGIILLGTNCGQDTIDALGETFPMVILNAVPGTMTVDSVAPDDEGGVRLAVRRLAALGHRRIAFWSDWDRAGRIVDHTIPRTRGYQLGVTEAGLNYSRIYGEEVSDRPFPERMERGFRAYLEDPQRPTAIVCVGDSFAHGVLRMALKHGINVPDDLSIFGFDGVEFSAHSHPRLSTVDIQRAWMGREAVRLMMRQLAQGDCPPSQVTVQAKLIERETSGPAPK